MEDSTVIDMTIVDTCSTDTVLPCCDANVSSAVGITPFADESPEGFFDGSAFYHPEIPARPHGVIPDPVPYMLGNDEWISVILLFCFIAMTGFFSKSRKYIKNALAGFFFPSTENSGMSNEGQGEIVRMVTFFVLQASLLMGLFFFVISHEQDCYPDASVPIPLLLLFFTIVILAYFVLKHVLYRFVLWIFFDRRCYENWKNAYYFILSAESVFLFPMAVMAVYFDFSLQNLCLSLLIMLLVVKILLFFRYYIIFSFKLYGILHFIAYFCALEIVPLIGVWHALVLINESFILKY